MLPFAVLAVSTLISYERAKAESLGFDAKGGLMERAERIIVLCVGLAFPVVLVPVLWVMLALTSITAVQRFVKVWRQAPGPNPMDRATPPTAPPHSVPAERTPSARHATTATRWREWREATAAERASRAAGDEGRWRARRGAPRGERLTRTSVERAWRRRDRTRP